MKRPSSPRFRYTAVLSAAAALAALLIGASQIGVDGKPATDATTTTTVPAAPSAPEASLFAGLAQRGGALGSAQAPVTLVEYADLQCPYCAQWSRDTLPTLVENYVKTGKLRIVFRGLAFIDPDSDKALRTVISAGGRDHLWDVVHGLYLNQGPENTGWVTDELVRELAAGVQGLDGDELINARWDDAVASEIERAAQAAQTAGVNGTPAFQVGPTGGSLELVQVDSLGPEGIVPAIEAALAR